MMLGLQAFLLALLACLLILYVLKQNRLPRFYPPGPIWIPVIGGLWKIGFKLTPNSYSKLAAKYGNVYSLPIGSHASVIVSEFPAVKEFMINHSEQISNRPLTPFLAALTDGKGIIFSNGDTWKQHRKFGIVTMRKLGIGKKNMERQVEEEARQLVEYFACAKGQLFDPSLLIRNSVVNVICGVTFGTRFSMDDSDFLRLVEAVSTVIRFGGSLFHLLYESFPRLMKHLPGPHNEILACAATIKSFARNQIDNHRAKPAMHEPQDFVDFYLLQMEKSKHDPGSTYDDNNLTQCITDFFLAGMDTTTTTLQWGLLLMATHPGIQAKVHKEIDDVLGSSPSFEYQDHKNLPYTMAVIHEILRAHSIFFVGLPRQCIMDVNLLGFFIPKGTYIILDIDSVLLDPKIWEAPTEFYPNHFLDKEGRFVEREQLLAFGAGPRVCIGKQLARIELFVFFTSLLRRFTFQLPEGVKENNKGYSGGFLKTAPLYKFCAVPRHTAA